MIVLPYRRPPAPPTVGLLTDQGVIVDEHGAVWEPAQLPERTLAWCSYDTARTLLRDGRGEALCWNGEEIRWRHARLDASGWKARPSDVSVLKVPFPEDPVRALRALKEWRSWLAGYGASPTGTTGSAAMSLLRATLDGPLVCSVGERPPLRQTMGGRQQLGSRGSGTFAGRLEQWDLPAAYASTIGELRYGGRWWRMSEIPVQHDPDWWAQQGRPVFVEAKVRVLDVEPGPLLRRPRKRTSMMAQYLDGMVRERYPSDVIMQGLWTWQELEAAQLASAVRILSIRDGYVHLGGSLVFGAWWEAVQDGRRMRGLAGMLAKMTGNALWGRFCMDVAVQGNRTIRSRPNSRKPILSRPVARRKGGPPPAHDLAETVSGRVRAQLYLAMVEAGPRLLSAHTDGFWTEALPSAPAGPWRRKMEARQLDLIDPQTLRYWPRGGGVETVMAGCPASEAPDTFQRAWENGGYGHTNDVTIAV